MFADDTSGLEGGKHLPQLLNSVNTELTKIATWLRANKMACNTSKTKYIIFHTKGKKVDTQNIQLTFDNNEHNKTHKPELITTLERIHNNHNTPESRTYKLLGIYLDEHLTFEHNTKHLLSKLSKATYCINKVKKHTATKSINNSIPLTCTLTPNVLHCNNQLHQQDKHHKNHQNAKKGNTHYHKLNLHSTHGTTLQQAKNTNIRKTHNIHTTENNALSPLQICTTITHEHMAHKRTQKHSTRTTQCTRIHTTTSKLCILHQNATLHICTSMEHCRALKIPQQQIYFPHCP